jgi:hypothetical protein
MQAHEGIITGQTITSEIINPETLKPSLPGDGEMVVTTLRKSRLIGRTATQR